MAKKISMPHGEGSFSQLKNGSWEYKKNVILPNGERKRLSASGKTQAIALERMKEKELKATSQYVDEEKEVLYDAMIKWAEKVKKPTLKEQSYDRLKKTINNQIRPSDIGYSRYQFITSEEIQVMIATLNSNGYSYSVIKKTYDALNAFFRYASAKNHIENPMLLVTMPRNVNVKKEDKEIVWFEQEDIDLFLKECHAKFNTGTPRYKGALVLGANIYMGLRIGELIALQWKDIDLESDKVFVTKTWVKIDNPDYDPSDPNSKKQICKIQSSNKTNKNRIVPLSPHAKKLLLEHKLLSPFTEPDDYVISTINRSFSDAYKCNDTIKTLCKNANTSIQNATTHSLRHTCASLLFRAGNRIEIICQILGNSREVCEKTYVHFVEEQLNQAVIKMDNNLIINI